MGQTLEERRAILRKRQREWRKKNPDKWQQIMNRHHKKMADKIRQEEARQGQEDTE